MAASGLFGAALLVSIVLGTGWSGSRALAPAAPARRIVAMNSTHAELCFALGRGDRVVGVGDFCDWPPAVRALPHVGGQIDPELERIVALEPDLVLAMAGQEDLAARLAAFSIPCRIEVVNSLAQVQRSIRRLGVLLEAEEAAEALLLRYTAALARLRVRARGQPARRVLVVVSHRPDRLQEVFGAAEGTFYDDTVRAAGGLNVLAGNEGYVGLSLEALLQLDPEVVIDVFAAGLDEPPTEEEILALWRQAAPVRAVVDGRLHYRTGSTYVVPGPRFLEVIDDLGACVRGETDD